jgi:hypothetical protein
VPSESSIFTVVESGERATVAFRDWPSAREAVCSVASLGFFADMRAELIDVVTENNSAVLAIDMAPADYVNSAFLGILIAMHKRGVKVELLNPSADARQVLEITRLDQLFVVRE